MTDPDDVWLESLKSEMKAGSVIDDHLHALATEARLSTVAAGHCLIRIEESGPVLRELLARAADGAVLSDSEARLLFRGLYILGGARDPLAFRPLLRLVRLPHDRLDGLLGDSITESLSRIAAGAFDGDADALLTVIGDLSVDEFVRYALFGAATFLAWEGRIDREAFAAFLERFHRDRLAVAWDMAWIGWLEAIAFLPFPDLAPLVHESFRNGWIDPSHLNRADFDEDLAAAVLAPTDIHRFQKARLGYIEDVLVELEEFDWADDPDPDGSSYRDDPWVERPTPVTNPWRDVGRNDPCPCGSGKKAKKCCLNR